MMSLLISVLCGVVVSSQDAPAPDVNVLGEVERARSIPLPELTLESLPAWSNHIALNPGELGFEAIPWIASFRAGVFASSERAKPLLFWAMNGHPLGCT